MWLRGSGPIGVEIRPTVDHLIPTHHMSPHKILHFLYFYFLGRGQVDTRNEKPENSMLKLLLSVSLESNLKYRGHKLKICHKTCMEHKEFREIGSPFDPCVNVMTGQPL